MFSEKIENVRKFTFDFFFGKCLNIFSENVENANPRGWIIGFWYD